MPNLATLFNAEELRRNYRSAMPIRPYMENVLTVLNAHPAQDALLFGLELETNPAPGFQITDLQVALQNVADRGNCFIAKRDGSVPRGLEIVTQPLGFTEMLAFADRLLPLPAQEATNTGVHIHISRSALTETQIWRIIQFVHNGGRATQGFITAVARRAPTHYCERNRYSYMPSRTPHYSAVSLSGHFPTVEIRLFKSTNNPAYLKSYVEFCAALVAYCADGQNDFEVQTPYSFMNFVTSHGGMFGSLARRFRNASFQEFALGCANANAAAAAPGSESAARGVVAAAVATAVAAHRERRTQTVVPTNEEVRSYIRSWFGNNVNMADAAAGLRSGRRSYRLAQQLFVTWYADHCYDPATGERRYIRTQRGLEERSADRLRIHALAALRYIV